MFEFIKYISPLYYYRLAHKMPHNVFLSIKELDTLVGEGKLNWGNFSSYEAKYMDLAYQALEAGYFTQGQDRSEIQDSIINHIEDNYRFVNRIYGLQKAMFVLLWRLLQFNNPIKELKGFFRGRSPKIKKRTKENQEFPFKEEKEVLAQGNKVSVIIPTLNRYKYLKDVLADLEKQTYANFDVWICDQSENFNADFYKGWNLDVHVFQQEEKALWRARNECVRRSNGSFLLFFDDDSRVEPDWIVNHLKIAGGTIISAGITETLVGGGLSTNSDVLHLSGSLDTGNVMIHRNVFQRTGIFDEKFEKLRMGDGEFGLRCLLHGFELISNPKASRVHLKGESGGLRQMGAWDAIHSIGLFKPRPIPSSLYLAKKHFNKETAMIYGLSQLPKAIIPYRLKGASVMQKMPFIFLALILSPILVVTFLNSWNISNKMKNN